MSEPEYQSANTDDDLLPVVDDDDKVLRHASRREIHMNGLMHRSVHLVIVNSRGQVLLQKRSVKKDSHPGFWDISVGGHVDAGEDYDTAAVRELREEMGVDAPFREVGRRRPNPENGWEFVRLYECQTDGPVRPDPEEIDEVRWVDPSELFEKGSYDSTDPDWKITGSGLAGLRLWAEKTGRL